MATLPDQVRTQLAAISGRQVQAFSQRARAEEAGYLNRAGGGYCTGICLDWVRRVLYKPSVHSVMLASSSRVPAVRLQAQVDRQLRIQVAIDAARPVAGQRIGDKIRSNRTLAKEQRNLADFITAMLNGNAEVESFNRDEMFRPGAWQRADLERHSPTSLQFEEFSRAGLNDLAQKLRNSATQLEADAGNYPTETGLVDWWHVAKPNLAAAVTAARNARGAGTASQRAFSEIDVVHSAPKRAIANGDAKDAIIALARAAHFVEGSAAVIGFQLIDARGVGDGHAVALWRRGQDQLLLLDPNYGIYSGTLASVVRSLLYLFGGMGHQGIYNEDGQSVTGCDYVVFGRRG